LLNFVLAFLKQMQARRDDRELAAVAAQAAGALEKTLDGLSEDEKTDLGYDDKQLRDPRLAGSFS